LKVERSKNPFFDYGLKRTSIRGLCQSLSIGSCNSDSRGRLVGGGGVGGRFFRFLGYLGKGEKIFLRGFYLRAGLVDKGVWSSIGSRWKVFAFREKVVGQRLRGSGMIELMG